MTENLITMKTIIDALDDIDGILSRERNILLLKGGYYIGNVYMWNDGSWYYGDTVNNCADGNGIYYVYIGDGVYYKYIGEFKNGRSYGYGICKTSDGEYYKGQWYDGLRNGYGTTYLHTGDTEAGMYNMGVRDGWFKHIYPKTRSGVAGYTVYYDMDEIKEYGELL